jgi:NAD(P) transhydrogenase subunit beta
MSEGLLTVSYLGASVLFILSLGGLANQETARRGNVYGMVGIALAILVTQFTLSGGGLAFAIGALAIGGGIGAFLAARVAMTSMPELVAVLHSFVGLAAVLVGIASYVGGGAESLVGTNKLIHEIEIFLGVLIGGITFTGSIIAFGKLRGSIKSTPLLLPGRHALNAAMIVSSVCLGIWFCQVPPEVGIIPLLVMTLISFVLGAHLVMGIGGADMPVVVSMLNSYSGWAAAATGFMLSNDLLIVTGALVGSSGAILSTIMCQAMNRSIWNVIFGGFGGKPASSSTAAKSEIVGEITPITAAETGTLMKAAKRVMIIPGYGMAVAQAQHTVQEITKVLRKKGTEVQFGIHPVAGRLPGHMNVLLAEAKVPYDIVFEMEEVNDSWDKVDVVLVIGANDIVNPGALDDPSSPIYGMPVLECWKATDVVVMKRSMGTGYSGVDNPLFYKENTHMLFGDAKASVNEILAAIQ